MQSDSLLEKVLVLTEEEKEEEEEDCTSLCSDCWFVMIPPRRKKWTEAEEKTLIDKYREMVADGALAKMQTHEKKFKLIACHVNSVHHVRDPVAYLGSGIGRTFLGMGILGLLCMKGIMWRTFVDNEVMGLGFEYEAKEGKVNYNGSGRQKEDATEKDWPKSQKKKTLYCLGSSPNRDSRVHNTPLVHNRDKKSRRFVSPVYVSVHEPLPMN